MTLWHPSSDKLIEFSSGVGSAAMNIAVSAHLHFCKDCLRQVVEYESVAAVLFEQQAEVTMAKDGFETLMERIVRQPVSKPSTTRVVPSRFPPVVEKLMAHGTDALCWKKPMKNLRVSQLLTDEQGLTLGLHHMKAGCRVPQHTHRGHEISLVIEGGFSDQMGSYGVGDFITLSTEHHHSPQADADGDCWLLSVVEAPVRLTGPLGWILNPFIKA
ncbi:ChrR family anti-sigma-E factor [Reinekea sp.]|uniref:ChrR family anti-sigma-E factor n=1 Tax=Reinekea sp. TaxID=1970455 RepID=UPI00257FD762|nr:ChrR family anti-sigma-E factor [Reinekea sp.]